MLISAILFLLQYVCLSSCLEVLTPQIDVSTFEGVLSRMPPWVIDEFPDIRIGQSKFLQKGTVKIEIDMSGQKIIYANSPVDALYGLHYFLRNFCSSSVSWDGRSFSNGCQLVTDAEIVLEAPEIRYFGNPATYSYSFAWWKWEEWEPFIDWLALSGFNLVLTPLGQDIVWKEVWRELGVPDKSISNFLTAPPYQPWHWMGNLNGLGGPVSDDVLRAQFELNFKIVTRLTALGIVPVMPMFDGSVPVDIMRLYPNATVRQNEGWNGFNATYSVSPTDPLFKKIGTLFLQKQKQFYGGFVSNVYSADPFIERFPSSNTKISRRSPNQSLPNNIFSQTARAIYETCRNVDINCVWVVQSWMFQDRGWSQEFVKDFVTAVPIGQMLILDSFGDQAPLYLTFDHFHGQPFVWCVLHNFGGSLQMRGNLKRIGKFWTQARFGAKNLVGGGLTMEAIHQNYVIYSFAIDCFWVPDRLDVYDWLTTFALSRYGAPESTLYSLSKLWTLLADTFYSEPQTTSSHFPVYLYKRPRLGQRIKYWFDSRNFNKMITYLGQLNGTIGDNELFRRDYTDILRETVQYTLGNRLAFRVSEAFGLGDDVALRRACEEVDKAFLLLDKTTSMNLYVILYRARAWGASEDEADRFEANTKMLFTLWGPRGEIVDYAHREYSGLIANYYRPRWSFFCASLLDAKWHFDQRRFNEEVFEFVERPFIEPALSAAV